MCLVTILKSLENKTTLNIVNVSYSFTQFSTIAKTYTTNGTRTVYICYQFRILRNLRIDIKDRLEEYSQSIEIDIHDCTQSQKSQLPPCLRLATLLHSCQSGLFSEVV